MELFKLKKSYRYFIYGAAFMGKIILNGLKSAGYEVHAFFDKNAETIGNVDGITVYRPEKYLHNDPENSVVIVAISNPFDHTAVAEYISSLGYNKIIFRLPCITVRKSDIAGFAALYELIQQGKANEESCFPEYGEDILDIHFSDGCRICETQEHIVAYVPVDICFTLVLPDTKYVTPDALGRSGLPVFMGSFELFQFFRAVNGSLPDIGKHGKVLSDYIKNNPGMYRNVFPPTDEGMTAMLANRSNIFEGMKNYLQQGMDFFIENPIEAAWEKDHFNIIDGHHRVCFFAAVGLSHIPAKMPKKDYDTWVNSEVLNECIAYAKKHRITSVGCRVPHPNFFSFPCRTDTAGFSRQQQIGLFLKCNNIDLSKRKVIDVNSKRLCLAQFFSRLGSDVTLSGYENGSDKFSDMLNRLLYCGSIKFKTHEDICGEKYSAAIVFDILSDSRIGTEALRSIDMFTEDILIYESENLSEDAVSFVTENSSFSQYIKLGEVMENGKTRTTGVFCKGHIKLKPF